MSYDLTTIALVWLAASLILMPLMILAVRLAIIPLLQTIARPPRVGPTSGGEADRLAQLEQRVAELAGELDRLARRAPPPAAAEL